MIWKELKHWKTDIHSLQHFCIVTSFYILYILYRGRDSAVGIATRYGLDAPGIESRWRRDFPHPSRPAIGPTQPPVQWVPGVNRPGRGADHPSPPKNRGHERVELYLYSPSGPSWPDIGWISFYRFPQRYLCYSALHIHKKQCLMSQLKASVSQHMNVQEPQIIFIIISLSMCECGLSINCQWLIVTEHLSIRLLEMWHAAYNIADCVGLVFNGISHITWMIA